MKLSDLSQSWQDQLKASQLLLCQKNRNTPYEVTRYDKNGTRYFYARRCCKSWNDDKGHSMPFGGGTYWTIAYGRVAFRGYINPCGETEYELCDGPRFNKSMNGTVIPSEVATKKEVLALLAKIGIFD